MLKVTVQEKEDELECSCEAEGNLNSADQTKITFDPSLYKK